MIWKLPFFHHFLSKNSHRKTNPKNPEKGECMEWKCHWTIDFQSPASPPMLGPFFDQIRKLTQPVVSGGGVGGIKLPGKSPVCLSLWRLILIFIYLWNRCIVPSPETNKKTMVSSKGYSAPHSGALKSPTNDGLFVVTDGVYPPSPCWLQHFLL